MIYPVTGWFKITQYNDKHVISIKNFSDTTWLVRYPMPMEIKYDQGLEFVDSMFIKSITEK